MQQKEAIDNLEHLKAIYASAVEAVALGDGTLKVANNTYHTLAGKYSKTFYVEILFKFFLYTFVGFQSQVQKSKESASLALETIPAIEKQIQDTQNTVLTANKVCPL